MYIIREKFVAKPGQASKLAKLMKETMPAGTTVMTDLTGQFNTVVMETSVDDLATFEKRMEDYRKDTPENQIMMEKMKGYTQMYSFGGRQIFKIVE